MQIVIRKTPPTKKRINHTMTFSYFNAQQKTTRTLALALCYLLIFFFSTFANCDRDDEDKNVIPWQKINFAKDILIYGQHNSARKIKFEYKATSGLDVYRVPNATAYANCDLSEASKLEEVQVDFGRKGVLAFVSVTPVANSSVYYVSSTNCTAGKKVNITHVTEKPSDDDDDDDDDDDNEADDHIEWDDDSSNEHVYGDDDRDFGKEVVFNATTCPFDCADGWEGELANACPCGNANCTETAKSVYSIQSIGAISPGCMYVVKNFCEQEAITVNTTNDEPSNVCKKFLKSKGKSGEVKRGESHDFDDDDMPSKGDNRASISFKPNSLRANESNVNVGVREVEEDECKNMTRPEKFSGENNTRSVIVGAILSLTPHGTQFDDCVEVVIPFVRNLTDVTNSTMACVKAADEDSPFEIIECIISYTNGTEGIATACVNSFSIATVMESDSVATVSTTTDSESETTSGDTPNSNILNSGSSSSRFGHTQFLFFAALSLLVTLAIS